MLARSRCTVGSFAKRRCIDRFIRWWLRSIFQAPGPSLRRTKTITTGSESTRNRGGKRLDDIFKFRYLRGSNCQQFVDGGADERELNPFLSQHEYPSALAPI